MVRLLLACCFLFLVQIANAQDKIAWSKNEMLSWDQFETRKNPGFGFRALTFSGISYEVTTQNGMIDVQIHSYFMPDKSWVQKGFENEYLLSHEQLHFDITEIYARKMRQAMKDYEIPVEEFMRNNYQKELEKIYDNLYEEMVYMQDQYDKETDHSLNREAQVEWYQKIGVLLNELKEYSSSNP